MMFTEKNVSQARSYLVFGCCVAVLALFVTTLYYLSRPYVEVTADTPSYLAVVNQMRLTGNPLNIFRLPIYPLFILIICALTGRDNLLAVSIVQGGLFVLTALEFYLLVALIFRRSWLACLVSIFVGTNVILISYGKPIMTEGLSLWLLTTNVLIAVSLMHTWNLRLVWAQAVFLLLLFFTRPEWIAFPLILFGYLLFTGRCRSFLRPLLVRVLIACGVLYVLVGAYIAGNSLVNHYVGLTSVENMNLLGKVIQYRMYNETTPEYQSTGRIIAQYVEHGQTSPYQILGREPELAAHNAQSAGDFARSVILHHPLEFVFKTIPIVYSSLIEYYPVSIVAVTGASHHSPYDGVLSWLLSIQLILYRSNGLFLASALLWLGLLVWPGTRKNRLVQTMGLVVLTALWGIVTTSLGGYYMADLMRVHIVFDPLIILTVWGTLWYGLCVIVRYMRRHAPVFHIVLRKMLLS
jgi:hypothetical protein